MGMEFLIDLSSKQTENTDQITVFFHPTETRCLQTMTLFTEITEWSGHETKRSQHQKSNKYSKIIKSLQVQWWTRLWNKEFGAGLTVGSIDHRSEEEHKGFGEALFPGLNKYGSDSGVQSHLSRKQDGVTHVKQWLMSSRDVSSQGHWTKARYCQNQHRLTTP